MGAVGVLGLIHWEDGYANAMAQNLWITANLTQSVKLLAQRQRPASFGSNDDYRSFFSGHSSITTTAATTALWYAYHVKNPNKWAKPLGWTSVGLSLTTGILRILSGKHYPSDVITGFAVGTGVALLNLSLKKI
jgi:membrane-associated phospholipid phosphatase